MADIQIIIRGDSSQAEEALRRVGTAAASMGESLKMGVAFGAGLGLVTGAIQAVGAAAGALKDSVIGMNSTLEQSRISFTTMLGSAEKADAFLKQLADFAKTTPFEFPDLLRGAQKIKAMGFEAENVIPILRDVGNAASAMGAGKEFIDRVTLALGQMHAKTKVSAEEMNQLTEQGIPAWEILSKAIGKSVTETMKMSEQGKIAGDTMINAFHDWAEANVGGMMEAQSKTFVGAMSNIKDSLTMAAASGFKPLFDEITKLANGIANFVTSDQFSKWVGVLTSLVSGAIAWLNNLKDAFAPLGNAITKAFEALSSGDVEGALSALREGVVTQLTGIKAWIDGFAGGMVSAGVNLITQFAQGIIEGAISAVTAAMNFVGELIGAFLIGHSPVERGKLREARQGGVKVMEEFALGLQDATGPITSSLEEIGTTFYDTATGMATNLGAVKQAASEVERGIRDIEDALSAISILQSDLKFQAEDVKDKYDAQLKPLEDSLEAIRSQRDVVAELKGLELDLEDIRLRQAQMAAEGDPVERAKLKAANDMLRIRDRELGLEEEAKRLSEQAKKGKDISTDLAQLEIKRQILENDKKAAALADPVALAKIKQDQEINKVKKEQNQLDQAAFRIQKEMAAIPIEEEIRATKKAREDELEPINAAQKALERQSAELRIQQQEAQKLKRDLSEAVEALTPKGAGGGGGGGGGAGVPNAAALTDKLKEQINAQKEGMADAAKEQGKQLAENMKKGIQDYLDANGGLLGAIGNAIGMDGIIDGAKGKIDELKTKIGEVWVAFNPPGGTGDDLMKMIDEFIKKLQGIPPAVRQTGISELARQIDKDLLDAFKVHILPTIDEFKKALDEYTTKNGPLFKAALDNVGKALAGEGDSLSGKLQAVVKFLVDVWKFEWEAVKTLMDGIFKDWKETATLAIKALGDALEALAKFLTGDFSGAWTKMQEVVVGVMATVVRVVVQPLRDMASAVNAFIDAVNRLPNVNIPHLSLPPLPGANNNSASPSLGGGNPTPDRGAARLSGTQIHISFDNLAAFVDQRIDLASIRTGDGVALGARGVGRVR